MCVCVCVRKTQDGECVCEREKFNHRNHSRKNGKTITTINSKTTSGAHHTLMESTMVKVFYRRYHMLLQTLSAPISFHIGHNAAVFEQNLLRRKSPSLQVQHLAVQNEPP